MKVDFHLHLWQHSPAPAVFDRRQVEAYCRAAEAKGIDLIAVTEHLDRFSQVLPILQDCWAHDPNPDLRAFMNRVFTEEQGADLDDYVSGLLKAKEAGWPVLVGIEVGWWPGKADELARIVGSYPWDIVLGSVHSLDAWMFDAYDDRAVAGEWARRGTEDAWDAYVGQIEALAGSGLCDVLAHLDLIKITGRRPEREGAFQERLTRAAAVNDLAVEVSSAGWRKEVAEPYPSPELLRRLGKAGVPVTLASDAHRLDLVGDRVDELADLAVAAGVLELAVFEARKRATAPLG